MSDYDWSDIHGNEAAKRAAEIAVTGRHSLLLLGSSGTGRTMIARRMATLLPGNVPFRAPHHTISEQGMFGRLHNRGEVGLAQDGVLFLDELADFRGSLRERVIREHTLTRPWVLVAAESLCLCGRHDNIVDCPTSDLAKSLYQERLNKIRARFDLSVILPRILYQPPAEPTGETSAMVRERIARAQTLLRPTSSLASTIAAMRGLDKPDAAAIDEAASFADW